MAIGLLPDIGLLPRGKDMAGDKDSASTGGGSFHVAKVSNVEWRTTGLAGAALRNELNVRFIFTHYAIGQMKPINRYTD